MSGEKETGWVHWFLHWHMYATKQGLGEIITCGWRWSRKIRFALFRAEDEATWHEVPLDRIKALLDAQDAAAATAALRG
jgi:hypothetical protein